MATKVEIWNMALSHLGVSKEVASVTERSKEAEACNRFYDSCVAALLTDHSWPFATKYATLALIEASPNDEWGYSYRYPTDCFFFRKILSGTRNDTLATKVAYEVAQDDSGRVIFTDAADAECKYTVITGESYFTSDFILALSFRLAYYIAPRVTAGDPFKLGPQMMQKYQFELSRSTSNAFNEDQSVEIQDTESIQARN